MQSLLYVSLKVFWECILGFAVLLIILALVPILMPFLAGIYLWRLIVILLYNTCNDKGNACIISSLDVIFMMDKFYANPYAAIPIVVIMKGKPEIFKSEFSSYIQSKISDSSYMYKKLLQFPTYWLGYYFWKMSENFDIENHIKLCDDKINDDHALNDFMSAFSRKPFVRNQPLWDLTIIPNFKGNGTTFVAIMRVHHIVADGLSLVKMFHEMCKNKNLTSQFPKPASTKLCWSEKIIWWTKTIFGAPYLYIRGLINIRDSNCIQKGLQQSGEWVFSFTKSLNMNELRAAKIKYNKSLTTILMTALTGAIRNYFQHTYGEHCVPEFINCVRSLPLPDHPDHQLVNHWTVGVQKLHTKTNSLEQRILQTDMEIIGNLKSPLPFIAKYIFSLVQYLPVAIIQQCTKLKSSTLCVTNVPGPTSFSTCLGMPVIDMYAWLPLMRELNAVSVAVITYNGSLRITLVADKTNFKNREALDTLCTYIDREFQHILFNH